MQLVLLAVLIAIPTIKRGGDTAPPIVAPKTKAKPAPKPKAEKPKVEATEMTSGKLRVPLEDLHTPRNITIAGPNTLVIEIKRSAQTTKATKVRVSVDGKVNKILT